MNKKVYAIILAAGSGSRMNVDTPKQFNKIAGKSVIEHTVSIFDNHPRIDAVYVVIPEFLSDEAREIIDSIKLNSKKNTKLVIGGSTRNLSTLNAISKIPESDALVLIHDSARPLLSTDVIDRVISALDNYKAVDTVAECSDTIVEVNDFSNIVNIPNRSFMRRGQTPQAFHIDVLKDAYAKAQINSDLSNSDDCGVVKKYLPDISIHCVYGSEANIKITHPIDLVLADRLFMLKSEVDDDALSTSDPISVDGKVVVVFGASSGIGEEILSSLNAAGSFAVGFSRSIGGVDVSDRKSVAVALKKVHDKYGRIDAVINSAGELNRAAVGPDDISYELNIKSIEVNLIAPFIIAGESRDYLAETKGHLVLFTSSSYTRGRSSYSAYSASKAGVVNLTQALSDEWMEIGVRVNCINPERTSTKMRKVAFPKEDSTFMLTAREVSKLAVKILTKNITGQIFDVRRNSDFIEMS